LKVKGVAFHHFVGFYMFAGRKAALKVLVKLTIRSKPIKRIDAKNTKMPGIPLFLGCQIIS
jgi:hypothetical protein